MSPAAITFGLTLAIVLGAYGAFVVWPERRLASRVRSRLRPETTDAPVVVVGLTENGAAPECRETPRCALVSVGRLPVATPTSGRTLWGADHGRARGVDVRIRDVAGLRRRADDDAGHAGWRRV